MDIRKSSLITTIAGVGLMFAVGGAVAYTAKPIYVKGSGAGGFVNTTFSFYALKSDASLRLSAVANNVAARAFEVLAE
jgi:hypothetical protein